MKKTLILIALFITINANAQDGKTTILTVTGQGKTIEQAKNNALRSAIEQAFGAFVSSNTTILNDSLIKDEIVSVANGNIQKYDVLNETSLPDGSYVTIIKATVSLLKLTSFCESKGVKVEFKGGLFAMNIGLQELNEKNELIAWSNTKSIIDKLKKSCFSYKINVTDPTLKSGTSYKIPIQVNIDLNKNYEVITDLIFKFCNSISMTKENVLDYSKLGKNFCSITIPAKEITNKDLKLESYGGANRFVLKGRIKINEFFLRNSSVRNEILSLPWDMAQYSLNNFSISNGINTFSLKDFMIANQATKVFISKVDNVPCIFSEGKENPGGPNISLFGYSAVDLARSDSWIIYKYPNFSMGINSVFNGQLKEGSFGDFDNIFTRTYTESIDIGTKRNKGTQLNVALFTGVKEFLKIAFEDLRDISEIKKITEYKIIIN